MNLKFVFIVAIALVACSNQKDKSVIDVGNEVSADSKGKNYLTMKIDGKEWTSDRDIFGSYHFSEALGPGLINIAGVKGNPPNDQNFNINLYNTTSEGEYTVNIADNGRSKPYDNIAQFALLTPSNYLCGGTLQGSQMTINITKVSKNPQIVQATFSGFMQCVEGNKIVITEGKFYYNENNN